MELLYYFAEQNDWMFLWQRYQIFPDLERIGCHVTVVNPLHYEDAESANEALRQYIRENKVDVFMTPCDSTLLFEESLQALSQKGIPTILILFDSRMTPYRHADILSRFDVVLMSDKDIDGFYQSRNSNSVYFPYAAGSVLADKVIATNDEIGRACFLGTLNGSRGKYLSALVESGAPLDLYSKPNGTHSQSSFSSFNLNTAIKLTKFDAGRKVLAGFVKKRISRDVPVLVEGKDNVSLYDPVGNDEMVSVYSKHALSLSFSAVRSTGYLKNPVRILHLRNFEIPMSRGIQMSVFFPELAECFEEDKEIIFYRSQDELIEKTKYWLDDKRASERLKIRENAFLRAKRDHTWSVRFLNLFKSMGML